MRLECEPLCDVNCLQSKTVVKLIMIPTTGTSRMPQNQTQSTYFSEHFWGAFSQTPHCGGGACKSTPSTSMTNFGVHPKFKFLDEPPDENMHTHRTSLWRYLFFISIASTSSLGCIINVFFTVQLQYRSLNPCNAHRGIPRYDKYWCLVLTNTYTMTQPTIHHSFTESISTHCIHVRNWYHKSGSACANFWRIPCTLFTWDLRLNYDDHQTTALNTNTNT